MPIRIQVVSKSTRRVPTLDAEALLEESFMGISVKPTLVTAWEDEMFEDLAIEVDCDTQMSDGSHLNADGIPLAHLRGFMDSLTRIGGEVCRLRAEVDGLLEQNGTLLQSFQRLKDVMAEKGSLDMDDFELACDVLGQSNLDDFRTVASKKIAN